MAGTYRAAPVKLAALMVVGMAFSLPGAAMADCSDSAGPNVNWSECRKRNLMLDGTDLSGAVLSGADLSSTDLRKSVLDGVSLEKAQLDRAMMDGSKAQKANFEKAQGVRSSFVGTNLAGANFTKSEMQRADFTDANLSGVNFEKSELARAMFTGADLSGVSFSYANIARADLRGAKISGRARFHLRLHVPHAHRRAGPFVRYRAGAMAGGSGLRRRGDQAAGRDGGKRAVALRRGMTGTTARGNAWRA